MANLLADSMAAQAEGVLTPGAEKAQQPAEIAEELAATDANPTDLPQALREDQIQNAVAFLAHPKVRDSSKESKTSFLERKGLTGPEIDEAFSRLPETSGTSASAPAATQPLASNPRKPFPTTQALQPVTYVAQPPPPQAQSYRWGQVVIGASVLVAGAYALKQLVGPYAVNLYRKLYNVERTADENQGRQDGNTAEVLASAISSQNNELRETVQSLKEVVLRLEKGKETAEPASEQGLTVLDLREELHALALTLSSGGGKSEGASDVSDQLKELKTLLANRLPGNANSAPKPSGPLATPHASGSIANGGRSVGPPAARFAHSLPSEGPSGASTERDQSIPYHEVLEMLERGETPPNVRSDINDKPPDPTIPPPAAQMQPRPKPWERSQSRSPKPNGMPGFQTHGEGEPPPSGVTITELDDSPSSSRPSSGAWKPPPVPQASLNVSPDHAETAEGADVDDG